jgi:glucokinase
MTYLLAADVGGTKTDVAIFAGRDCRRPVREATLASREYATFSHLLAAFLDGGGPRPDDACFGVAGPVLRNRARLTNLPWEIIGDEIAREFGLARVEVINDLVAVASAIPHLTGDDLVVLQRGERDEQGAVGVVAPGTGLGVAFCVRDRDRYLVCPSEGGHAGFSPGSLDEVELLRFLLATGGNTSFESLCSGTGLPDIHRFLVDTGRFPPSARLAEKLAAAFDQTPAIVQGALDGENGCPLCRETVRLFTGILAEICGNLAVTVLARGGIYIGGGIPPRILPLLQQEHFLARFRRKGKMSGLLATVPVAVIVNPRAALLGAAAHGLRVGENA